MKKNQLLNLLNAVKINGGATLKSDGSFLLVDAGYMVSLSGYEKKIALSELNIQMINEYLLIAKKLKAYARLWIDNNILYLDISIKILNKQQAIYTAKKNKQKAIFDLLNKESIYIN